MGHECTSDLSSGGCIDPNIDYINTNARIGIDRYQCDDQILCLDIVFV